jgi:hypothetical protein
MAEGFPGSAAIRGTGAKAPARPLSALPRPNGCAAGPAAVCAVRTALRGDEPRAPKVRLGDIDALPTAMNLAVPNAAGREGPAGTRAAPNGSERTAAG